MSRIFCPLNRSSCKFRSSRRIQHSAADLLFTIQRNISSTRFSPFKERCPIICYFIGNLMRFRRRIVTRYIKNLIDAVAFSIDCTLNGDTSRLFLRKRRDGHGQHQRKRCKQRQHAFYSFHISLLPFLRSLSETPERGFIFLRSVCCRGQSCRSHSSPLFRLRLELYPHSTAASAMAAPPAV